MIVVNFSASRHIAAEYRTPFRVNKVTEISESELASGERVIPLPSGTGILHHNGLWYIARLYVRVQACMFSCMRARASAHTAIIDMSQSRMGVTRSKTSCIYYQRCKVFTGRYHVGLTITEPRRERGLRVTTRFLRKKVRIPRGVGIDIWIRQNFPANVLF